MTNSQPEGYRRSAERRSDGIRSREAILREAARLATVEGIEGLSLGRLADAVGMSKSGLFAHFRSKEELQLATIETADAIFASRGRRSRDSTAPRRAWLACGTLRELPRATSNAAVSRRLLLRLRRRRDRHPPRPRARPRDEVVMRWSGLLQQEAAAAQAAGELDVSLDPAQIGFELNAYLLLGNAQFIAGRRRDRAGASDARVHVAARGRPGALTVTAGPRGS